MPESLGPTAPTGAAPDRRGTIAAALLCTTAALAGFAVLAPGAPMLIVEPELIPFSAMLVVMHALPFVIAARFAHRATTTLAVFGGVAALMSEGALMAWAFSILDDDAQAGLVYVFVTPLASAGIAAAAAALAWPRRSRAHA